MAHFDTRINTPGALDNAGSVAALLALAETLGGVALPFDLEFIAFDGEEYLPIGDDEYVRRAGEASFADIPLAINMDGIGYVGGHNTVAQFNVAPELAADWKRSWPAIPRCSGWSRGRRATTRPSPSAACRRWRSARRARSTWPISRLIRSRR